MFYSLCLREDNYLPSCKIIHRLFSFLEGQMSISRSFPKWFGCRLWRGEKTMIDWIHFHYFTIYVPLKPYKPLNLNGGCRDRGIGVALQRPKCWHLSRFHLHVFSVFQQICYGGVNTVGFCCRQSRVKDDNKELKRFLQSRSKDLPKSVVIIFRGTWGSTSFTRLAIFASLLSSVVKPWTLKPKPIAFTPRARQTK